MRKNDRLLLLLLDIIQTQMLIHAHIHSSYSYEHLRETEPKHQLAIDEVATDAFVINENVSSH